MNFFQSQSHYVASKRHHFTRILFLLLLVAVLPVFVWAVMTQRIELRKRAATAEPPQTCWNKIIERNGKPQWPNACKGMIRTDRMCAEVLVPLSSQETAAYNKWTTAGRPYLPGCMPTPTPNPTCIPRPACLDTNPACEPAPPHGNTFCPPTAHLSCNYSIHPARECPAGYICVNPAGSHLVGQDGICIPAVTPTPTVSPTPPGCQSVTACPDTGGPCTVSIHCPSTPTPTPTVSPELRADLIIKDITLERVGPPQFPCDSYKYTVLVANYASGSASLSRLKTILTPYQPQAINSCTSTRPYNGSDAPIPMNDLVHENYMAPGAVERYSDYFNPSQSGSVEITARADYLNQVNEENETNNALTKTFTVTPAFPTPTPTTTPFPPTPTPTPMSQTIEFRVKLDGVTGDSATGAKIQVKLMKQDGTSLQLSSPLTLAYADNGTYVASAILTNPFPAGTAFTIKIKGEKHIAMKYCRQVGQTGPCADTEFIVVPNPVPLKYGFDFTGIALPPGDLYVQDGRADQTDVDRLTALLSKPRSMLTPVDLLTGDLNYDGVINGFDLNLLLKTLGTRYDE